MAASVFISYARKDADLGAAPLDAALRPLYAVWRDLRGIDPAQDFTAEIEKALQAASHVVVCVTPDTLRDDSFVRREIAYASYLKKPILVARFADVPPPIHIFTNTWIDFFKGWDAAFDTLCRWLGGEAVASNQTGSAPAQQPDPYKPYLEALYADLVDSIRASVFSDETITLRAVETVGDVQRKTRQLNPKYIPYTLRETPDPDPTPEAFDSLRDAYAHGHCAGRVLLLGEPGAGKTTTLLAFARDAAAARLSDPSQPLPIFARISGWDSHAQTPLPDWLAAMHNLDAAALQSLIDDGKALLLLDGLDELGSRRPVDPTNDDFDPRERFLQALPPTGKVILSSRVEEYRQIGAQAGLSCAVRLERLDDVQMQTYLADVAGLWEVISADADLTDALRTPLLLALVRVAYEDAPEHVRALGDLSAGDLNDRIWDAFIDKRWAHEQARMPSDPLPYTAAELKRRLGLAAMRKMVNFGRDDRTRILTRDVDVKDGELIVVLGERLDLLRFVGDERLSRWSEERAPSWRFLHLGLRDALTFATAMVALRDPENIVRQGAAIALQELGDGRAVGPLIATLYDADGEVRSRAASALGRLNDARAVEPLIATLHDPDWNVRSSGAIALGELGDASTVEVLIASLLDTDEIVRRSAAVALGKLGDARAVEPLITTLSDPNVRVRVTVAEALGELSDTRAVKPLITVLSDPDERIREKAVEALGRLGDARAFEPLAAALGDPEWSVRISAAAALGNLGDARAFEPLAAALGDPEWMVHSRAADAQGESDYVHAVEPLMAALQVREAFRGLAIDRIVNLSGPRAAVVLALGVVGGARAVKPMIIAAMHDRVVSGNSSAFLVLVEGLISKLGEVAVEQLIAILSDPDKDARSSAADYLRVFGGTRAVEPLIAALGDSNSDVRYHVADALSSLRDARAVEPLIVALRDPSPNVRVTAAMALRMIGDERAVAPFIVALRDSEAFVRYIAVEALQEFPDHPAARAALADYEAGKLKPRDE